MAFVSLMVFATALLVVGHVAWFTLMPALPRMAALLRGENDSSAMALAVPQIRIRDRRLKARAATARLRTAIRAAA